MIHPVAEPKVGEQFSGACSGTPTRGEAHGQLDVLNCGQKRNQVVGLEHETDAVGPKAGAAVQLIHPHAADVDMSGVGDA